MAMQVNLPLESDMGAEGWGAALKEQMHDAHDPIHATMADWVWVWGPGSSYNASDMLSAFYSSAGWASREFQAPAPIGPHMCLARKILQSTPHLHVEDPRHVLFFTSLQRPGSRFLSRG